MKKPFIVRWGWLPLLVALGGGLWWLARPAGPEPPEEAKASPLEAIALPALQQDDLSDLRPELAEALNPRTPFGRRLALLAELRETELSPVEGNALLAGLMDAGRRDEPEPEYFHEIGLALQQRASLRSRFARVLATLALDATLDETVRDYSMQHLTEAWRQAGGDPDLRRSIVATCRELVSFDPAVSSSALLSLHLLGAEAGDGQLSGFAVPDAELVPLAASILAKPATRENAVERMTALRIAGERRFSSLLPEARRIAAAGGGEALVTRMAAIACIARFRDPADRGFLESLPATEDPVAGAIRHALAQIP